MVARVGTVAFQGIDVLDVDVQVEMTSRLPAFHIVGFPYKAVGETRERVRAALNALGLTLPPKRITLNLAPADVAKEGSHFDLPIALGLLGAMGVLSPDETSRMTAMDELGLDGTIASALGVVPAAIHAAAQSRCFVSSHSQGGKAVWAGDLDVITAKDLLSLINHVKGTLVLPKLELKLDDNLPDYPDLLYLKGQETAKRALEIAAAGGHNLLMIGSPGFGKSMLAHRLPGFHRQTLEALRQPIETGRVSIARANAHVVFPARFLLIGAMNPCRCGYLAYPGSSCSRVPKCGEDYQGKISSPLIDRMDLVVEVPAVNPADLSLLPPGKFSADVATRVAAAQARQRM